jgi:uncharacterized membrane protein
MNWTSVAPAVTTAFVSSLVEAVEALTIVLAVASVRGWRPAATGALAGLALLVVIVLALGPLLGRVPMHVFQLLIGVLLLLFGMRWLRKAFLRAAGAMAIILIVLLSWLFSTVLPDMPLAAGAVLLIGCLGVLSPIS